MARLGRRHRVVRGPERRCAGGGIRRASLRQRRGASVRSLLGAVPGLLEGHFARLRQAEQAALAAPQATGESTALTPGAWLNVFRKDMRSVLLAELDIRLQPVEGLLAALRSS